ncbi:uncharacterized protein EAE97_008100 [Botrytis byssoidea]|uniref:Uncharacterized protein n=1 Tax=Botrytis byssoidea TaxID=139641 RepID=A0A9P5M154_9HELO|nr:uncharacterized protein EAE97_008100 [Botrytis byssoidea]KAF7935193.1 hypothetical protein EAE97_008100 [Botrytis byssoidea]
MVYSSTCAAIIPTTPPLFIYTNSTLRFEFDFNSRFTGNPFIRDNTSQLSRTSNFAPNYQNLSSMSHESPCSSRINDLVSSKERGIAVNKTNGLQAYKKYQMRMRQQGKAEEQEKNVWGGSITRERGHFGYWTSN